MIKGIKTEEIRSEEPIAATTVDRLDDGRVNAIRVVVESWTEEDDNGATVYCARRNYRLYPGVTMTAAQISSEAFAIAGKTPRKFSQYKMVASLKATGQWDAAKTFMEAAGVYDLFVAAQILAEDDPFFASAIDAAKAGLGVTDEQVEKLLAASVADGEG